MAGIHTTGRFRSAHGKQNCIRAWYMDCSSMIDGRPQKLVPALGPRGKTTCVNMLCDKCTRYWRSGGRVCRACDEHLGPHGDGRGLGYVRRCGESSVCSVRQTHISGRTATTSCGGGATSSPPATLPSEQPCCRATSCRGPRGP